jgi:hypothetical protein
MSTCFRKMQNLQFFDSSAPDNTDPMPVTRVSTLLLNFFKKNSQSQRRLRAQNMSRARELFFLDLAEPSTSHQDAAPADIPYATTPREFIILRVKFIRLLGRGFKPPPPPRSSNTRLTSATIEPDTLDTSEERRSLVRQIVPHRYSPDHTPPSSDSFERPTQWAPATESAVEETVSSGEQQPSGIPPALVATGMKRRQASCADLNEVILRPFIPLSFKRF